MSACHERRIRPPTPRSSPIRRSACPAHGCGCRCDCTPAPVRRGAAGRRRRCRRCRPPARDGVDVGDESSFASLVPAEQVERPPRSSTGRCCSRPQQQRALAPDRPSAGGAPARHRRSASSRSPPKWNRRRAPRLALGGQPDRQQAAQRVLHAGRQDRLLLRHPRPAASSTTTRSP